MQPIENLRNSIFHYIDIVIQTYLLKCSKWYISRIKTLLIHINIFLLIIFSTPSLLKIKIKINLSTIDHSMRVKRS